MPQQDVTVTPHLGALAGGIATTRLRRIWQKDLGTRLETDITWRRQAVALDRVLAGVHPPARQALLSMVLGQIDLRCCQRGWVQAFDLLNQARAYCYLDAQGCNGIAFLPGTSATKTPDLVAESHAGPVLCEVKTLHFSAAFSKRPSDLSPQASVRKLALRLPRAVAQLATSFAATPARRIAYFCLDFPAAEFSPDEIARHLDALSAFASARGPAWIEILFDLGAARHHCRPRAQNAG